VDSQEALDQLERKVDSLKIMQSQLVPQARVAIQSEINGINYAITLLKQVVEHDEAEQLNQLAEATAQEYYNSQDD